MNRFRAAIVISCALVVAQCSGISRKLFSQGLKPMKIERTFRITGVNICSPEGYITLIRRNHDLAALAFFDVRRGSQSGTGVARYVAYVPAGYGGDFRGKVRTQEGTVSVEGWSGFHPLVIQHGKYKLRIGPFRLTYYFPTCLWLEDKSAEYAPTPWTRIEDVDASESRLRWFRYDATGDLSLEISPEDLLPVHQPK